MGAAAVETRKIEESLDCSFAKRIEKTVLFMTFMYS